MAPESQEIERVGRLRILIYLDFFPSSISSIDQPSKSYLLSYPLSKHVVLHNFPQANTNEIQTKSIILTITFVFSLRDSGVSNYWVLKILPRYDINVYLRESSVINLYLRNVLQVHINM